MPEPPGVVRPHRLPRDRGPRRRRPGDARAGGPAGAARVRRARLPVRGRLGRLPGDGHGAGARAPGRAAGRPSGSPSRSSRPPRRPTAATTSRSPTPRRPRWWAPTSSRQLRDLTLAVYEFGAAHAAERGLILADTKLEFGAVDGELLVIDEMLTPDSSRYWPRRRRTRSGRSPPSFDKQFVRDHYLSIGWNRSRRRRACRRGDRGHAGALRRGLRAGHRRQLRRPGTETTNEVRGAHRRHPPARRARSAGRDRRAGAARARLRQRERGLASPRPSASWSTPTPRPRRGRRSTRCAGGSSPTP